MSSPALEINNLNAWYGESHVLHGINLTVEKGEVVCFLGRNGAGRTTTLRSILGLVTNRTGSIKVNGHEVIGMPTYKVANLGIGYCPEERGIFTSLTCEQNFLLPPKVGEGMAMSIDEIYGMFPNLYERRSSPGGKLSGGEQQRVAVARAMVNSPAIILADEPSGNLDSANAESLHRLFLDLRDSMQQTFVIVTHNENLAEMADRKVLMKDGLIINY